MKRLIGNVFLAVWMASTAVFVVDLPALRSAFAAGQCSEMSAAGVAGIVAPAVRLTEPAELLQPFTEFCNALTTQYGDKGNQCFEQALTAVVLETQTVEVDPSMVALAVMGGSEECAKGSPA